MNNKLILKALLQLIKNQKEMKHKQDIIYQNTKEMVDFLRDIKEGKNE